MSSMHGWCYDDLPSVDALPLVFSPNGDLKRNHFLLLHCVGAVFMDALSSFMVWNRAVSGKAVWQRRPFACRMEVEHWKVYFFCNHHDS